jgi:ABC-type multidrug transport system ATPase subunit
VFVGRWPVGPHEARLIFALAPAHGRSLILRVRELTKRFGDTWALRGASFSVRAGEVLGLVGPNGSGKTTLLECVAGLLAVDGGTIGTESGAPRADRREMLFYMPDGILPWPEQSVHWTLHFSASLQGASRVTVDETIPALGLGAFLQQRVGTLSKGQRKRVLIALALLTPQPLVLLDEPFDGLDLRQVREIGPLFRRVAATGRALLLSIHQLHDAARVCDRLVLLSDGRVVGEGTLDELRARADRPDGDVEDVFLALT